MKYLLFLFGIFLLSPPVFASDLLMVIEKATGYDSPVDIIGLPETFAEVEAHEKVALIFIVFTDFFLYIVGIGAVVMIVYSGARFVFAAGDEEQIGNAKKALLYAVLGLIAVILSLMIIDTVVSIFYKNR